MCAYNVRKNKSVDHEPASGAARTLDFFRDLGIPAPDVHLGVGSGGHGVQTGAMLAAMDARYEALLAEGWHGTPVPGLTGQ